MRDSSGDIVSVSAQPLGAEWRTATLLFVLTLLFFSLFTFQVIPPSDPAQNLYQILTRDLGPRPVFIGYTILGILFTSVFSALGLPVDVGLNWMSAVFGALGAACGYLIALTLVRDRRIALTAVVLMALSGLYWFQAEIGDLYVTSYSLVLLAMACFLHGRYGYAGGSYAAALLVYPVAALVGPFFLWVAYRERIGNRNFFHFVGVAAVIYLPVVLITFQEYFFGRMGIMPSALVEPVVAEGRLHLDFLRTLNHNGYIYTLTFNFMLLFVTYGVIDTFFRHRAVWLAAMSAALGPMVFAFINHGTDLHDAYFLAALLFLSILASLSLWHLLSRLFASRTLQALVVTVCLVLYGSASYALVIKPMRDEAVTLKQAALQLERQLPSNAVLLAPWGNTLHYNLYTRPFIYDQPYPGVMWTGRCINVRYTTAQEFKEWLSSDSQIYLLEGVYWQGPLKEIIRNLLPRGVFRRLSGEMARNKQKLLSFDSQIDFVKVDTFSTKSLILYQVLPVQGGPQHAAPNKETAHLGDIGA